MIKNKLYGKYHCSVCNKRRRYTPFSHYIYNRGRNLIFFHHVVPEETTHVTSGLFLCKQYCMKISKELPIWEQLRLQYNSRINSDRGISMAFQLCRFEFVPYVAVVINNVVNAVINMFWHHRGNKPGHQLMNADEIIAFKKKFSVKRLTKTSFFKGFGNMEEFASRWHIRRSDTTRLCKCFGQQFYIYVPDLETWFYEVKEYVKTLMQRRAMLIALVLNPPESYRKRRTQRTKTISCGQTVYTFVPFNKSIRQALPSGVTQLIYQFLFRENNIKEQKVVTHHIDGLFKVRKTISIADITPCSSVKTVMQRLCYHFRYVIKDVNDKRLKRWLDIELARQELFLQRYIGNGTCKVVL